MGRSDVLITSDIHLTDRPEDEYRWELFPWLLKQVERRQVAHVCILGDLTDSKDRHSARLVGRVVDCVLKLAAVVDVWLLKGNHDYVDPQCPFFGFLGQLPRVHYVSVPQVAWLGRRKVLMLPHVREVEAFNNKHFHDVVAVFTHHTFKGAKLESGVCADWGMTTEEFADLMPSGVRIVSGDVHVPQRLGCVLYCGAPHPVRFGDTYQPRVLWWSNAGLKSLSRATMKKHVVRVGLGDDLERVRRKLEAGDQVKVLVDVSDAAYSDWDKYHARIVALCRNTNTTLASIEAVKEPRVAAVKQASARASANPAHTYKRFCRQHELPKSVRRAGSVLLAARLNTSTSNEVEDTDADA
jgi:hypothetical protein